MELTEQTAEKIRSLKLDPDAKLIYCLIPLGSITWSDESPDDNFLPLLKEPDRDQILNLYAIRINYWDTGTMSQEDRAYWEKAQRQFPAWPLFQRLELSEEERQAHEQVENEAGDFIIGLFSDADESKIMMNDRVMSFSATFDLEKEKKRRWWEFWR